MLNHMQKIWKGQLSQVQKALFSFIGAEFAPREPVLAPDLVPATGPTQIEKKLPMEMDLEGPIKLFKSPLKRIHLAKGDFCRDWGRKVLTLLPKRRLGLRKRATLSLKDIGRHTSQLRSSVGCDAKRRGPTRTTARSGPTPAICSLWSAVFRSAPIRYFSFILKILPIGRKVLAPNSFVCHKPLTGNFVCHF